MFDRSVRQDPLASAPRLSPAGRARSGAALVLVLAALALCMFLALAILGFIRAEDRGARASADLVEVRALTELPEKVVIAQIRRATRKLGTGATWTSQPGMIRVFEAKPLPATATLPPRAETFEFYKLYSATRMVAPGTDDPTEDAADLKAWAKAPDRYTDLNEPITVLPLMKQGRQPDNTKTTRVYPIADPDALPTSQNGKGLVDGFEMRTADPAIPPSTEKNPMPMPVSWLYVLRDGTIAEAFSGGNAGTLISKAREDNPIIGRIAFWTDDESCKLNLNTATEPAPWEAPSTRSVGDEANAKAMPALNEFYRMSGHPAYTSLAPVLRHLGQAGNTSSSAPVPQEPQDSATNGQDWWDHLRDWHRMFPRSFAELPARTGSQGGTRSATDEVLTKKERLFGSVDEFFFAPGRENEKSRPQNTGGSTVPTYTQEDIRRVRFFLTTHSRAPELNLFNAPKLSLWPVQKDTTQRNEMDQAFVTATTLSGELFSLQRDAVWQSEGNPGSSQSQDSDMKLQRNRELFDYLQLYSSFDIPGFGGNFEDKYDAQSRDQLLTSMFDMVRWGVNPITPYGQQGLAEPFTKQYAFLAPGLGQTGTANGEGAASAAPGRMLNANSQPIGEDMLATPETQALKPAGYAGPTQWTKGFGRFPIITEVALVLAAVDVDRQGDDPKNSDGYADFADRTKRLMAFVVVEPFVVAPGVPAVAPVYHYRIVGLENFAVENKSLNLPANAANRVACSPARLQGGGHTAYPGVAAQFLQPDGTPKELGAQDEDKNFPFISSVLPDELPEGKGKAGSTLSFSGGTIKVEIYSDGDGQLVQVMQLNFPPADIPAPLMAISNKSRVFGLNPALQFEKRFKPESINGAPALSGLILRGDVVRSMQMEGMTSGDARIMAGRVFFPAQPPNKAPPWFKPVPGYDPAQMPPTPPGGALDAGFYAHTLRDGASNSSNQYGYLDGANFVSPPVRGLPLLVRKAEGQAPVVVSHDPRAAPANGNELVLALNADARGGDFDNGPGIIEDGPFIHAPGFNSIANQKVAGTAGVGGWFQRGGEFREEDGLSFSPWRQAASGFLFGSLPTGVYGWPDPTIPSGQPLPPRPWQTLLLCPNPAARTTVADQQPDWEEGTNLNAKKDHFGFKTPRDHLWLEFFWMPPVKPEGFCDGFATEGKVNMNYQMLPFTWIKRDTALRGALQGVRITAIPSKAVTTSGPEHYKNPSVASPLEFRYAVNADATLEAFEQRVVSDKDVFRSPSEICDQWLVPEQLANHTYTSGAVNPATPPTTFKDMLTWWEGNPTQPDDAFEATGDNSRESPYAQLYPRLCTRSNVFTVHWRVQLLHKSRATDPKEWDPSRDTVAAEQRGSTMIERYLDPNADKVPDFARASRGDAVDDYYRWRIVSRKPFTP